MLSRVFSTDASALVVRAGVRLLRLLVSSTVGLTAGTELGRMVQRLLPSLLSRASEELFTQLEVRSTSSGVIDDVLVIDPLVLPPYAIQLR